MLTLVSGVSRKEALAEREDGQPNTESFSSRASENWKSEMFVGGGVGDGGYNSK